ncbi:hypothetical protein BDZ45DRAFT_733939 [Acephala macrosclerotiorum]|nr:hypothetical protein BDZ45DRAFT_733939 [Acephala macrosclerotiorum]
MLMGIPDYLGSITSILTTGYKLRIYCEGTNLDRLTLFPDPKTGQISWFDKEFYHNARADQSIRIRVAAAGARPAGSWTKHGWTVDQNADCSNQAHIQLSQTMLAATRASTDNRFFAIVRSNGLGTGNNFNHLDFIRPLSRTILHELFHVVAGLNTATTPPAAIVTDVPKPGTNPPTTYGTFNDCMSQKNAPIPTVRQAECLTMLAAGLYLDKIQDKPAFWSVGVVDRTTLKPANLPGTSSTRLRHRALRNIEGGTV